MLNFIGGVIVGIILSLVAIVTGKKMEVKINQSVEKTGGKAVIIKKHQIDPIDEIING